MPFHKSLAQEKLLNSVHQTQYLYGSGCCEIDDGLAALERVRQLAPNYPGLQNLSQQLGISKPQPPPVPAPSTKAIEAFNNDNDADEFANTERSSSSLPFYLIAGITVVAIIAALSYPICLLRAVTNIRELFKCFFIFSLLIERSFKQCLLKLLIPSESKLIEFIMLKIISGLNAFNSK